MAEVRFYPRDVSYQTDIADFQFVDCYFNLNKKLHAETSDYPREDNTQFIDHFSIRPARFTLDAFVSGTIFRTRGQSGAASNPQADLNKRRAFRAIVQSFSTGALGILRTPVASYENIYISEIDENISLAEGNSLRVRLSFTQILSGISFTGSRRRISKYEAERNVVDFGITELEGQLDVSRVRINQLDSLKEVFHTGVQLIPVITQKINDEFNKIDLTINDGRSKNTEQQGDLIGSLLEEDEQAVLSFDEFVKEYVDNEFDPNLSVQDSKDVADLLIRDLGTE